MPNDERWHRAMDQAVGLATRIVQLPDRNDGRAIELAELVIWLAEHYGNPAPDPAPTETV